MPASAIANSVKKKKLTYLSSAKLARIEETLGAAIASGVKGDVVEFGIALGGSAIVLAKQGVASGRAFHGFDVFAMIPPPTSEKDDKKSKDRYEKIASGTSKGIGGDEYYGYQENLYDRVCKSFEEFKIPVDGKSVVLYKGLFEDTVPTAAINELSFVHVDCDWYDPVRYCLEYAWPKLSPGGSIVFDDYHDYGGCKTAVDEFVKATKGLTFSDGYNVILTKD